jgi:signal transduction histidine kinase
MHFPQTTPQSERALGGVGRNREANPRQNFRYEERAGRLTEERGLMDAPPAWVEGIAHDVQNLLAAIISIADCAEAEMEEGEPVSMEGVIPRIGTLATNAAEILSELLSGSKGTDAPLVRTSLKEIVEGMMGLLRISVPGNITLRTDLAAGHSTIAANMTQMRRVILNLVMNAAEAIGDADGTIQIAASGVTEPDDRWGDYVRLEISDTGDGIPEDAVSRVFERSCSAKGAGHGLGLAVVRSLVRAHGGTIKLVPSAGRFTKFQVILPCCKSMQPHRSPAAGGNA